MMRGVDFQIPQPLEEDPGAVRLNHVVEEEAIFRS